MFMVAGTQSRGFLQDRRSRDWVRFEKGFLADATKRREAGLGSFLHFSMCAGHFYLQRAGMGLAGFG